ncbi:Retrovirus-related Pol polyprotein from transposon [Sesamum angolense]|uniref:Retrovirus-related Pol polyprotein from transposon n=1 Tax=Sesamum angolense TaxID=2727404 RepID=A0AAE1W079_9LAMI|nr:Retrovirus-related Pol polyprotein from transposon [Sesamum angolense]
MVQPVEELLTIVLTPGDQEKVTKIRSKITEDIRNQVVNCLRRNKDIFAWTPQDFEGIDPGVITHHLNLDPSIRPACPNDFYLLPRIDQLVDSISGYELLSVVDASQGYHQIMLALEDHKRVSFITSDDKFCYIAMPFGLKNAGATYQRLVDKIF